MRVAVITGGARGIGAAITERLRSDGVRCAVLDRLSESEAAQRGDRYFQADVADRAALDRVYQEIHAEWGRLDIQVSNAAFGATAHLVDQTEADVRRLWDVCLWGPWHCAQLAARSMIARGQGGNIVTISSVMSEYTSPGASAYCGAKAALNAMTRCWASELAPHRIRVNAIEPGWIDTPGERARFGDRVDTEGAKLPLGRIGTPADIAGAAAYLTSESAAYVTGTILRVDGGFTLIR
jgi:glucose 1-dehydrogenase